MLNVLITGATGNVGDEVIKHLLGMTAKVAIIAGVRSPDKTRKYDQVSYRYFDFDKESTFPEAFESVDILFLLRPPHISNVRKYFEPLLEAAKTASIKKVVFLSVQGAEKSSIIPHHKIEKLIENQGFEYVHLRPGYFMQNLTTTLREEIREKRRITLPAGKAKFNWIDVRDIGFAAAKVLWDFEDYKNNSFEITGSENLNFHEVAAFLSKSLGEEVIYNAVNPIKFYFQKKREGLPSGLILVMIALHFIPRFQPDPHISNDFETITGEKPGVLQDFLMREKAILK